MHKGSRCCYLLLPTYIALITYTLPNPKPYRIPPSSTPCNAGLCRIRSSATSTS